MDKLPQLLVGFLSSVLSIPDIALFLVDFYVVTVLDFFLGIFLQFFPLSVDSSHKVLPHSVFTSRSQVISAKGVITEGFSQVLVLTSSPWSLVSPTYLCLQYS